MQREAPVEVSTMLAYESMCKVERKGKIYTGWNAPGIWDQVRKTLHHKGKYYQDLYSITWVFSLLFLLSPLCLLRLAKEGTSQYGKTPQWKWRKAGKWGKARRWSTYRRWRKLRWGRKARSRGEAKAQGEAPRMRDSQMMRGNKKSRACLKVRENHMVRASQNPRPSQRASTGYWKVPGWRLCALESKAKKGQGDRWFSQGLSGGLTGKALC